MKNPILFLVLLTCIILSSVTCSRIGEGMHNMGKVFLTDITGETFAVNLSLSYILWVTGSCGDTGSALPVHNDDLIYVNLLNKDEIPLLLQYNEKDGTDLSFNYDVDNDSDYFYTMNNTIIQLNLYNIPDINISSRCFKFSGKVGNAT